MNPATTHCGGPDCRYDFGRKAYDCSCQTCPAAGRVEPVKEEPDPITTLVLATLRASLEAYARENVYGKLDHLLAGNDRIAYRALRHLDMAHVTGPFGIRR